MIQKFLSALNVHQLTKNFHFNFKTLKYIYLYILYTYIHIYFETQIEACFITIQHITRKKNYAYVIKFAKNINFQK